MFFQDRKIKYSIRKLSVATVSLAIGFLFAPAALGVAQVAQADELSTTEQVENKAENQVSVVSFATEQEESETTYVDTTNKVTWTFAGYDKEKIVVGKGRQTFLGSWVPTPNPEYVFKSSKAGVPLPQSILGMLPKDEASYKVGDTIVAKQPAVESVVEEEKDYVWTFKGYDQKNATYNGKRVTFTGIWEVTPRPHHVSYTFVSVTSENGNSVSAKQPAQATYIDSVNDGTWTFKGYDAASAVVNKANVEFVGKWEFKVNPTNAETYTPQVTEETIKVGQTPDLTDNVTNLPNLPAGTKVVDITPAGQIDTTKPGTYTGKVRVDYPDGSSTEVSVSVNVLPAPETQTYKVTYRFESATADNNLPAEVLSLLPQSGTYTTSSSVAIAFVPEAPMPVEVAVANGTWTFLGYQEVEEGSNLTFVGKWVFEAKQDPSPQPQPAPTPQPAPQPNPVPPVNPGGEQGTDNNQADRHQSEQPRKPEENPPAQGPAGEKEKQATLPNAGSTAPLSLTGLVTSSLLAGLAVLLLGRKRKDD
ncbi:TPA: SHIRT domain-containing protein [Streptococcus pneumoniae]|nr:YSIRK-type signal peptide-containing protein [Streptococcus pneumoniae]HEU8387999.1 YSIRK-type signal peptide-containing protein [Streptococcus pneumoniae]HEU9609672.1 YSIRK-type signal peptide-containing protein [Streptococcus pneumoniae]HEW9134690.1 YSIRK-type signal peptide-containing protein [Streptococcus pneumoniae]HEX0605440.1 YSIRK-type signal peptide-containing protein [Streptococcus pneumoniae]